MTSVLKRYSPGAVFGIWAIVRASAGWEVPVDVAFMLAVAVAYVIAERERQSCRRRKAAAR